MKTEKAQHPAAPHHGGGEGGPGDARAAYQRRRGDVAPDARSFWDERGDLLDAGLLGAGRFERYLATFRRKLLPLVHRQSVVEGLLALDDPAEQRRFFDRRWNTLRWRSLFRIFFSRAVMARLGRSPEQFAQVEGAVADRLLARTEHVLTAIPAARNPFIQWILGGAYPDLEAAHPYLSRGGHARLGEVAGRITLTHDSLEEHLPTVEPGRYSAFNLSNIGEYLPEAVWDTLYARLVASARPGARVAYWNLFVPRARPDALADRVAVDPEGDAARMAADRAFFYGAFRREVIT